MLGTSKILLFACLIALSTSFAFNAPPTPFPSNNSNYQYATLAGGCFWCMEAIFERIPGVIDVESGYAGGHLLNPSYLEVKSGKSGYAEVIKIAFDPKIITYENIVDAFFYAHDPTTLNRQGIDVGHQYRSAIYYHDEAQKEIAERVLNSWQSKKAYEDDIVTEINALNNYYPAEDYHQDYFNSFKENQFCTVDTADIAHKIEKFFNKFTHFAQESTEPEVTVQSLGPAGIKIVKSTNPFHPWHNISYGNNAPEIVQAFIEVQKGSTAKYEIDKQSGYLALDRVVNPNYPYPTHYGFIPQTLYGDGDALDILVLSSVKLDLGVLVPVRVIGMMHMVDGGEMDDKILTVVHKDSSLSHVNDIGDLDSDLLSELKSYFENYKKLEGAVIIIKGFEGKETAYKAIDEGIKLHQMVYGA